MVVDGREPAALAEFYAELLGGQVTVSDADWVVLTTPGGIRLAFQRSPEHEAPRFPDPAGSQQFHLDIEVDDIDAAEQKVLTLGAVRVPDAGDEGPEDTFRVFRDPAGHTFCFVWDQDGEPVNAG